MRAKTCFFINRNYIIFYNRNQALAWHAFAVVPVRRVCAWLAPLRGCPLCKLDTPRFVTTHPLSLLSVPGRDVFECLQLRLVTGTPAVMHDFPGPRNTTFQCVWIEKAHNKLSGMGCFALPGVLRAVEKCLLGEFGMLNASDEEQRVCLVVVHRKHKRPAQGTRASGGLDMAERVTMHECTHSDGLQKGG